MEPLPVQDGTGVAPERFSSGILTGLQGFADGFWLFRFLKGGLCAVFIFDSQFPLHSRYDGQFFLCGKKGAGRIPGVG